MAMIIPNKGVSLRSNILRKHVSQELLFSSYITRAIIDFTNRTFI